MIIDTDHFRARLLQDALTEATAQHWEKRARDFDAVGTPDCDMIAANCRHHAQLIRDTYPAPISEEVQAALDEVP